MTDMVVLAFDSEGGADMGREKLVKLKPGRYRYKFVVDGEWTLDPRNEKCEGNTFGSLDSVIEV